MAGSPLEEALIEGVAGSLGGVLGLAVTYPLLATSTRLHLDRSAVGGVAVPQATADKQAAPAAPSTIAAFPAAPSHPPPLPRAMVPALLHLAFTEGKGGLYAGLGTACVSLGVSNLVYYALYALLRDALLRASPQRTSLGGVAALPVAALAGALNVVATNPLWVLVTRLQAHRGGHASGEDGGGGGAPKPLAVARQVYAEGGLPAFWRGTGASLVMVSNPVVQFAVFEWLMARARTGAGGKALPVSRSTVFASGALSKLAATLVTYPFLVLKSRQQAAKRPAPAPGGDGVGEAGLPATHPPRVRLLAQLLAVAREEGVQGLYRGLDTKLFQTVLAAAILFTTKDTITQATRRALRRSSKAVKAA